MVEKKALLFVVAPFQGSEQCWSPSRARYSFRGSRHLFARKNLRYQFIQEHRHEYSMVLMSQVLDVSVSGYYSWWKRLPSQHSRKDAELTEQVKKVSHANRGVYGSPRVHAELQAQGIKRAGKCVAWLMREQELCTKRLRHRTVTTQSDPAAQAAPICSGGISAPSDPLRIGSPTRRT